MLVLVKGERQGPLPLPVKQFASLVVEQWENTLKGVEAGKVVAGGKFAGAHGACLILDVGSADELDALVNELPLYPYIDWEITPLISVEDALAAAKQRLQDG